MATWSEVQRHFRLHHQLDADMDDEFALTVHFDTAKGRRAQRVMVHRYCAWGEQLVEVRSAFGELDDHEPEALLADNLHVPLGAIAAHGRFLVLVNKTVLSALSIEGLELIVDKIGMLADVFESRSGDDDRF